MQFKSQIQKIIH